MSPKVEVHACTIGQSDKRSINLNAGFVFVRASDQAASEASAYDVQSRPVWVKEQHNSSALINHSSLVTLRFPKLKGPRGPVRSSSDKPVQKDSQREKQQVSTSEFWQCSEN